MLEVINLEVRYGSLVAVHDANIEVQKGEFVAIVGPNGAGKSTTMKTVAGLLSSARGRIQYQGQDITDMAAHERVQNGLVLVPEGRQLFGSLTVYENLRLGAYHRRRSASPGELDLDLQEIFDLFPVLGERRQQPAATLSGGEQEMLAIGRGLMSKPTLLLLDHPSQGLAPLVRQDIISRLSTLRAKNGLTILLVEQDINLTMQIAERGYVMQAGEVAVEGSADELLKNDFVRDIYLGEN